MNTKDFERARKKLYDLLTSAQDPEEAVRQFIEFVSRRSRSRFWSDVRKLDFRLDIERLTRWASELMEREPPDPAINGYWFGLFTIADDEGEASCLYLAGSNRYSPDDVDWAVRPAYFPEGRYADSEVLRSVYRFAYRPRGPKVDGEYFCLWYAALAVAHLCRELSDSLLAGADRRAVAVGFDSGDAVLIGSLSRSGFEPAEYVPPPSVPTVQRTPSNALFYRVKDDTRGRWWLEHPEASSGEEIWDIGRLGERIDLEASLSTTVDPEIEGDPVDFTFAALEVPIVQERVGELVESLAPGEVQRVPIAIEGQSEKYEILNVLSCPGCLDMAKSRISFRSESGRESEISLVQECVINDANAAGHHIFRLEEYGLYIYVSREMKIRLEDAGVTGVTYEEVAVSSDDG